MSALTVGFLLTSKLYVIFSCWTKLTLLSVNLVQQLKVTGDEGGSFGPNICFRAFHYSRLRFFDRYFVLIVYL